MAGIQRVSRGAQKKRKRKRKKEKEKTLLKTQPTTLALW
jgi:hypothetical protein